jgi:hypothetical protein
MSSTTSVDCHVGNIVIPFKKKEKRLESFSYFGHNYCRLSQIGMKILGFVCREIYESVREGHCPFLLGFVRN